MKKTIKAAKDMKGGKSPSVRVGNKSGAERYAQANASGSGLCSSDWTASQSVSKKGR